MDMRKGFVTFADILGWKGIWKNVKENDNPLKKLINIKDDLDSKIEKIKKDYLINKLNEEYQIDLKILEFTDKIEDKNDKKEIEKIIESEMLKAGKERNEILEFLKNHKVNLEVDLISDTFVITSNMNKKENELEEHLKIVQKLIIKCLDEGLLIRGAISYGEYQKEKLVFVGPAIDEAASWHEQGEEIGIFLTPSAIFNFEDYENKELTILREPKLKCPSFKTLCVNWKEGKELFEKIYKNESPIIPEIAKKYVNTKKLLEEFEKENKS